MNFGLRADRRRSGLRAASWIFPDPSGRHQPVPTPSHARPSLFTGD